MKIARKGFRQIIVSNIIKSCWSYEREQLVMKIYRHNREPKGEPNIITYRKWIRYIR